MRFQSSAASWSPTLADNFWAVGAAPAALFVGLFAEWCSRNRHFVFRLGSGAAPSFWNRPSLMLGRRPWDRVLAAVSGFLGLKGVQYRCGSRHGGIFSRGD